MKSGLWTYKQSSISPAGWKSVDSVPMLVDRYMKKEMMVDEFVSHNMPLADINTAFDLMHAGKR